MGLQRTSGLWLPGPALIGSSPAFSATANLNVTGNKVAFVGRVFNKDRATKNITKVGFRFASVTKIGGSGLTVSLQDVSTGNGPPFQPDGTQDQTVAIANGDTGLTSNVWYQTNAFNATRTVAFGELVAVVIEYDSSGHLGSDAINFSYLAPINSLLNNFIGGLVLYTSGVWSGGLESFNPVILEFDDGTFGTLDFGWAASAVPSVAINTGSSPSEVALKFRVPFSCVIDGAWFALSNTATGANGQISLYNGTTLLQSMTWLGLQSHGIAAPRIVFAEFAEQQIAPNTDYYLAMTPSTTNALTVPCFSVANANHFEAFPGGTSLYYSSRAGGAWTDVTTQRPLAGVRISQLDDGVHVGGNSGRIIGSGL